MAGIADLPIPKEGKFAENILHFARALRAAGMRVSTRQIMDAIRAVEAVGFDQKQDYFYILRAVFVTKAEELLLFGQVFRLFWRDPNYLEHMMGLLRPLVRGVNEAPQPKDAEKRAAEALLEGANQELPPQTDTDGEEIEFDTTLTFSAEERLKTMDFEQMSSEETARAQRLIAQIPFNISPIPTRRNIASPQGHLADWRETLRRSMKYQGEIQKFMRKSSKKRYPNLVMLCDISGSMSAYSRMVLHFLHSISNQKGANWRNVYGFTFGTKLTNISRELKSKDVDETLRNIGSAAQDWEGGTRIASSLHAFNRDWSRRMMSTPTIVILITDGLDQGDTNALEKEMERLQLSARRLIWINPLFRWDGFAPKARGVRAMLPHVDCFRAAHNLASLEELADVLARPFDSGEKERMMRQLNNA